MRTRHERTKWGSHTIGSARSTRRLANEASITRRSRCLALASRPLRFEALEARLALSFTNMPITGAQRLAIEDGLDGLVAWTEEVENHSFAQQLLPVIGQSLGASLDLSEALDSAVVQPVKDYFSNDATPTSDELLVVLQSLTGVLGNLSVDVNPVDVEGGLQSFIGGSELAFHLPLSATRSLTSSLGLGPEGDTLGIQIDGGSVALTVDLDLDLTFGMDLAAGLDPADAFFVRVNALSASAAANAAGLVGVSIDTGFYDGSVSGMLTLAADLDTSITNPDADARGNITLTELVETPLDDLLTFTPSGSSSGSLTVAVSGFGGFLPTLTPTISFSTTNPFEAPELMFTGFDELSPFTNMNATSALSLLGQLGTWLEDLGDSSLLDTALTLVTGRTLGQAVDLRGALTGGLTKLLVYPTGHPQAGLPKFDSAQSLATTLENVLGLSPGSINATYNVSTKELSYHVLIDHTFDVFSLPLNLDVELGSVVNVQTSAQVNFDVQTQLEFTFGINLSRTTAEIIGVADAVASGQLLGDAHWSLGVGAATPVNVTLAQSATSDNTGLDDLVIDLNAALAAAGLTNDVGAARDLENPNRIKLSTVTIGPLPNLLLTTTSNDPASTQLGFDTTQFAFDTGLDDFFVEDFSANATATLNAPDIDASASFSVLALNLVDGSAAANFGVGLQLQDVATQTPGGRLYLGDMLSAMASDVGQIVVGPTLSGDVNVHLPVTATLLGVPIVGSASIDVSWPDVTVASPIAELTNFGDLLNFENLSEQLIFNALHNVGDYLGDVQGASLFGQTIPGLNVSLGQIFDYANQFLARLERVSADPNGKLNELEAKIETALGLQDPDLDLSLVEDNSVLRVDLNLGDTITRQLPVNLDLGGSLGHVLDVHGSAMLNASAGVALNLDFGIDLSDPLTPRPFLYETTDLTLLGKVLGTNIDFTTALGPFGLFIINGTLAVDADGNAATPDDSVTLTARLTDNDEMTAEGKIYLSQISLGNVELDLDGEVQATLPVFFPTSSTFQGNISLMIDALDDIANTTTLTFPDFQVAAGDFDMLNDLGGLLDTVDFIMLNVRDALNGEVFGIELPFVGSELSDAADFVEQIRTGALEELRNRFQESHHKTPDVVQQALFDALGPAGLDLLGDRNNSGSITKDDIGVTLIDLDHDQQADDQFDFDLVLTKELAVLDQNVAFHTGLPALGLEIDGNVEVGLGFQWALSFGVNREYGFYFDTSASDELTIGLEARIPDLHAEGRLAFLQVEVNDEDADTNPNNDGVDVDLDARLPSAFLAGLTIDLLDPAENPLDPDDNDKLTFEDLVSGQFEITDIVDASLQGSADLNLDLELSVRGDARFPSVAAELSMHWPFAVGDPDLTGGVPTVQFDNVRLNVGEFVNDFADAILKKVKQVTEPLDPIVDFLSTPIPVLSGFGRDVTPLQIVDQMATAYGYGAVTDFIQAVVDVANAINSIPDISDQVYLPMGSFDLAGIDLRQLTDLRSTTPQVTQSVDPMAELQMADASAKDFVDQVGDIGFVFPIIENPAAVFRLLMGQTVDLMLYDMPKLEFDVPLPPIKIGPIIPPLPIFAALGGSIGAYIDLAFGFDTHGWELYQETGDALDILSGLFVSDRANANGTGEDVIEAALFGRIDASVEISLGVVSAGVGGGVGIELGADLVDPNEDGRVHLDEFLDNIERGVTCTFDLAGEVWAHLTAYVELLFKRYNYDSSRITLVDFMLTDEDCFPDRFDNNDSLATATDLGVAPGLHVEGMSLETTDDEDWYRFELLHPDSIDVNVRHSNARGNLDLEVYGAAGQLLGNGTTAKDGEIVKLSNLTSGIYYARVTGNDQLNNYKLVIEPGKRSTTRVLYVSPSDTHNQDVSYYTWAVGRDENDGLTPSKPKASLASVLATYDLGPNDLIVFDTGTYASGATLAAADAGATYVGTVAGSYLGTLSLQDAPDNLFYLLGFGAPASGPIVGPVAGGMAHVILANSDGNVFDRVTWNTSLDNLLLDSSHDTLVDRSQLGGTAGGIVIAGTGGVNDAQDTVVRNSRFRNGGTSLRIDSTAHQLVEDNTFDQGGHTGIYLSPGVTATVRNNEISARQLGLYTDSKVADVHGNLIHSNGVGMSSREGVICFGDCAWIDPEAPLPNQVYQNDTGILIPVDAAGVLVGHTLIYQNQIGVEVYGDQTRIVANDIHDNQIGVQSTVVIGPENWDLGLDNQIHHNGVGVLALHGAEVRYNRIYANTTGVKISEGSHVHHNVIYRNTGHGVLVDGADDVLVENNTVFAPAGDGIRLRDFVRDVELRNNIVWAQAGTALYVEPESQFGYHSDHNNLYATASGSVAFQGKFFDDLYDWQVEAESDLHSLGRTDLAPTRDDPLFASLAADDYHLLAGSTSIDAGDPASPFAREPSPQGGRVNLGAYGNTPQATASVAAWLSLAYPEFYIDQIRTNSQTVQWETFNLDGADLVGVDLVQEGTGTVTHIANALLSDGSVTWTPSTLGIAGSDTNRYRIRLTTLSGPAHVETSREPFAIVAFDSAAANVFFVDDASNTNDQYTPASVGDNRNTGLTPASPKTVARPLVLSYPMGSGDTVRVDAGTYVHAVNLNLRRTPLVFDPRMSTVSNTLITGPTNGVSPRPIIVRANPNPGAVAIDMIDAPNMTLDRLEISGAHIGVRVRDGSTDFAANLVSLHDHSADGISIETASHGAELDNLDVFANGRSGIFIDSQLDFVRDSRVYANGEIGMALRSIGAGVVETNDVYLNGVRGIDVINPGPDTAVIGSGNLAASAGNWIHENATEGVFASGQVLVAGNSVWQNHDYGIRLNDGADALRNVVWEHARGMSARGSSSDILENRSYLNAVTGIEASFSSNIVRNITYSNQLHGIHADRFSGWIEHNLVYQTEQNSVHIEGPGHGARFVNNTVYEPCAVNVDPDPPGATLDVGWDWFFTMLPPLQPSIQTPVWGTAQFAFAPPLGLTSGGTFDLGNGGSADAVTPVPVPMGEVFLIDFTINALDLSSMMGAPIPGYGHVHVELLPGPASTGQMQIENLGGVLAGTVQFTLNLKFTFSESPAILTTVVPYTFTQNVSALAYNEFQVLQAAGTVLFDPGRPFGILVDQRFPSGPQWQWQLWDAHDKVVPVPEPQDRGDTCAEIAVLIDNQSRQVYLRNNIVYAEGHATPGLPINSVDIVVEPDSIDGWNSEHNIFTTTYGTIGRWAGIEAPTMTVWQTLTSDDDFSISPDPSLIWLDEDGDDDILGGQNGFDDNFHLESPYGAAIDGAIAPILDDAPGGTWLPIFETVVWADASAESSPGIDWGDPAWPFALEPLEHGQMVNLGTYGNTEQASETPPEYINLVYPLGLEELVYGRTYDLRWRSDGAATVAIELRHGGPTGLLEFTIAAAVPNTGSFAWTVPFAIPSATDYVLVIRRPPISLPVEEILGQSRRAFAIGFDTTSPQVVETAPDILDTGFPATVIPGSAHMPTNQAMTSLTLYFSENLLAGFATSPASYELVRAGAPGSTIFGDGDDVVYPVTPLYTPTILANDRPSVSLDIGPTPLPEGVYRLTAFAGITDIAGLGLDGNGDGVGGDAYVRFFTVDMTPPAVVIAPIVPNPTPVAIDTLGFDFSEAVRGFGLADVRISRDDPDGPNLLSGNQSLDSPDGVGWTLANLAAVTGQEGTYYLTLTASNSNITDLAGNLLSTGTTASWTVDLTAPTVTFTPVAADPRSAAVDVLTLTFSEPVYDFTLADLTLARDGAALSLAGASLTTIDNVSWTIGNLASLTATEGIYRATLDVDANLHDWAGNGLGARHDEIWEVLTTPPLADVVDVASDPRNTSVNQIAVRFTRPVTGFDLSDLQLTRDGSANLLTGSETLSTFDDMHFALSGLATLTTTAGQYSLRLAAAVAGIADLAGNGLISDTIDLWTMDLTNPLLSDIVDVSPDPRRTPVSQVPLVFTEAVLGLDIGDLTLTRDSGSGPTGNLLTSGQGVTTADNVTWMLTNVASLTSVAGIYTLTLNAATGITDLAGNPLMNGGIESWVVDTQIPTVDIIDVTPDPRDDGATQITIVFSEPIVGFDTSDLTLKLDNGPNALTGTQFLTTSDNITFVLYSLTALTMSEGTYELSVRAFGSGLTDLAGNGLSAGTFDVFEINRTHRWSTSDPVGDWSSAGNWSASGVPASGWHAILEHTGIAGTQTAVVSSNSTVDRVTVAGTSGSMVLEVQTGVVLTAPQGITVNPGGTLQGSGTVTANVVNDGVLRIGGASSVIGSLTTPITTTAAMMTSELLATRVDTGTATGIISDEPWQQRAPMESVQGMQAVGGLLPRTWVGLVDQLHAEQRTEWQLAKARQHAVAHSSPDQGDGVFIFPLMGRRAEFSGRLRERTSPVAARASSLTDMALAAEANWHSPLPGLSWLCLWDGL